MKDENFFADFKKKIHGFTRIFFLQYLKPLKHIFFRFSRFVVYWIQTDRHPDRQAKVNIKRI